MIPRQQRVPRSIFPLILKKGKRIFSENFSAVVLCDPETISVKSLFSCVVSKKKAKKAVERNLIKRRCYAALAPFIKDKPSTAYLFFFQGKKIASFSDIDRDVNEIMKKSLHTEKK